MNLIIETPVIVEGSGLLNSPLFQWQSAVTPMLGSLAVDATILLAVACAPFLIFTLVIHWLEGTIQRRLAERFGWKAVLWTGWLGTPVHELSHALLCVVFRHRIDDIALFEPDRESGRLGYVEHTFRKGNWFEELGNVFIGLAPLAGGSLALAALLWMFYPDAARAALESARSTAEQNDATADAAAAVGPSGALDLIGGSVLAVCGEILKWTNLLTFRFWAFIYLVLCIGSHMAPSSSDYRGASRGVFLLLAIVVAVVLFLAVIQSDLQLMISRMITAMTPLFALFALTILLCCLATAVVYLLTSFFPKRYTLRR